MCPSVLDFTLTRYCRPATIRPCKQAGCRHREKVYKLLTRLSPALATIVEFRRS